MSSKYLGRGWVSPLHQWKLSPTIKYLGRRPYSANYNPNCLLLSFLNTNIIILFWYIYTLYFISWTGKFCRFMDLNRISILIILFRSYLYCHIFHVGLRPTPLMIMIYCKDENFYSTDEPCSSHISLIFELIVLC